MSKSLEKGIDALLSLAARKSIGVTELAKVLKVNKSTAFRILDTFQKANMVEKDNKTLKYRLGPAILGLSDRYYNNSNIIKVARPVMKQLAADIHESVHLCVLSNNNAVIVDQVVPSKFVRSTKIGNNEPLHCSAVGKCLLAFTHEKNRNEILSGLSFDVFTEKTINNMGELNSEIQQVWESEYAVDNEELNSGVKCVAVPIFEGHGASVYSMGVSAPASKMPPEKINAMVPLLIKAAKYITDNGWKMAWEQ